MGKSKNKSRLWSQGKKEYFHNVNTHTHPLGRLAYRRKRTTLTAVNAHGFYYWGIIKGRLYPTYLKAIKPPRVWDIHLSDQQNT